MQERKFVRPEDMTLGQKVRQKELDNMLKSILTGSRVDPEPTRPMKLMKKGTITYDDFLRGNVR